MHIKAKSNKKGTVVLSSEKAMDLSIPSEDRWNYYEEVKEVYLNKILVGDKTEITYFDKSSWHNNDFEMETVTDMGGIVECDVKMEGEKLVGTITNNTNRNFKDILLVVGKRIIKIDNLKVGESIDISEEMETGVQAEIVQEEVIVQVQAVVRIVPAQIQVVEALAKLEAVKEILII